MEHTEKHVEHTKKSRGTHRKSRGTRRKVRGTRRDGETASPAESQSRATTQGKQCWHIVTDGRKQSEGLVIAVLASAVWMNKGNAFFLLPKPKRRLEDFKAWIRARGRPHDHEGRGPSSDDSFHSPIVISTIGTRQTEYHEALPSSVNVQSHLIWSFADDGNAS